jgi:hypothetical protein
MGGSPRADPPALKAVAVKTARDVVHLTYGRFRLTEEAKSWDTRQIVTELAEALANFARLAVPTRLSDKVSRELEALVTSPASIRPEGKKFRGRLRPSFPDRSSPFVVHAG